MSQYELLTAAYYLSKKSGKISDCRKLDKMRKLMTVEEASIII